MRVGFLMYAVLISNEQWAIINAQLAMSVLLLCFGSDLYADYLAAPAEYVMAVLAAECGRQELLICAVGVENLWFRSCRCGK